MTKKTKNVLLVLGIVGVGGYLLSKRGAASANYGPNTPAPDITGIGAAIAAALGTSSGSASVTVGSLPNQPAPISLGGTVYTIQ